MRKQLQLRGISRSPSDRMTSDGGCSESLNVHLIDSETAPVLAPENITDMYGPNAAKGLAGPALYIHKGLSYNNLLFLDTPSRKIMAYKKGGTGKESAMELYTLRSGEEINTITSVGNTVVICTDQRMEYVLFKNGEYKDLGDQIPIPAVEFRTRQYNTVGDYGISVGTSYQNKQLIESFTPSVTVVSSGGSSAGSGGRRGGGSGTTTSYVPRSTYDGLKGWAVGSWSRYLNGDTVAEEYDESYAEICNDVWELVKNQMNYVKRHGYFCTPVFARYALKLYDGSYIYQSVPILIGAGDKEFFTAQGLLRNIDGWSSYLTVRLNSGYKVKAYLKEYNYDGWEDIIDSIDLFLSTDIHNPLLNAKITGIKENTESSISGSSLYYDIYFDADDEDIASERIRNEVISKSNFYKIETFRASRMKKLQEGYDLMSREEFISQDYLVAQPTLPDDYMSFHRKAAENLFRYNNKIIMTGITQEISSGFQYLNGGCVRSSFDDDNRIKREFRYRFHLRDSSNNELTVFSRNDSGGTLLPSYHETVRRSIRGSGRDSQAYTQNVENYAQCYAWLAYPDTRCYRVDVELVQTDNNGSPSSLFRTYEMEPHPNLNCSFVYIGMNELFGLSGGEEMSASDFGDDEKREYSESNVIWASEMDNPFVFPAGGRLTFVSEVIALANATRALSEGQFGQFPIYVFTKDGIWSVPISDEGNFASSVPMSRDVALSKDTIQTIEQAIVFATDQGVMILQGSGIECISPNMEGDHYTNPSDLVGMLSNDDNLGALQAAYRGDAPFKSFLKGLCKVAFDYAGRRVLFFTQLYAYVYRLQTQTWHKLSLDGEGVVMMNALNSYPDCYLCCRKTEDDRYYLYDFSIEYASDPTTAQRTLPGLVITRPFDLDLPDVRKTITGIRVRGKYNRNDVKYILLGSMDGIHWGILPTLRGGSYKLFRLALVVDMEAGERITWVDVEFEQRLDNRMR